MVLDKTTRGLPIRFTVGLAGIAVSEMLLFRGVWFVTHFFTPLVWTFYILAADGLCQRLGGSSFLSRNRPETVRLALGSIGLWYIFEGYNLLMQGWRYVELPDSYAVRLVGYFWSFATIGPGLLVTRELIDVVVFGHRGAPSSAPTSGVRPMSAHAAAASVVAGLLCLASPFLVPREIARWLWAPVWAGFIFACDPINERLGRRSVWREMRGGSYRLLWTLLGAGLVCGILWELWNYWAVTKWIYTFPMVARVKIFEMPVFGFLGFPPFAVEVYVMYELLSAAWGGSADVPPASRRPRPIPERG